MSDNKDDFDIHITQKGEIYFVSGQDAAALHTKLQAFPEEKRNLEVGAFLDGSFTLKKITSNSENAIAS